MAYCKHIYNLLKVKPGNCVYTESGLLKSQYIIHLSIPLWKGGTEGGKDEHFNLINSYLKALNLAQYLKIKSWRGRKYFLTETICIFSHLIDNLVKKKRK